MTRYALDTLAVVALTGTVDQITDGAQRVEIENGHPLMARVTAMGCAASALNGAFLAVESDPFLATAAALLCFGVAGGLAGERATGARQFRDRDPRCVVCARSRHPDRKGKNPMTVDVRLNAIVDPERANGRPLAELAPGMVVAGGATLIQLRDKHGTTRRMIEHARAIKAALAGTGVPLVVNDRVDVALIAEADGVHVGQDDMRVEDARRLLGPQGDHRPVDQERGAGECGADR